MKQHAVTLPTAVVMTTTMWWASGPSDNLALPTTRWWAIRSAQHSNRIGVTTVAEPSQVQQVADELEIRNLVADLAHMADMASEEELSQYIGRFTEDACWEMQGNELRGRDDILAAARQRRASGTQGPGTNSRHVITTQSVRLDAGDAATGEAYFLFVGDTTTTPHLNAIGHYRDRFQRTPEGWKLAHRTITFG
jgi:3-phenylpropionate/cinnamic acid dioxygenase small subunit